MKYLLLVLLSLAGPSVLAAAEPVDPLLNTMNSRQAEPATREARGVLRARHHAVLASEQAGRIVEMAYAEGQTFARGEVLVRFDCSGYQAQRDAANAAVRAAQEELKHKQQLAALNSVGRFEVALAEARHAQARAEAQVYQVQVQRCVVKAPFEGQVAARKVQPHESVPSGAPLLEIVDNRSLEIHLLVPSRWVGRVAPDQPFTFIPDETGQPLTATVKRLGARIDEGSQTLLLIGSLPDEAAGLLAGMSGTARFTEVP